MLRTERTVKFLSHVGVVILMLLCECGIKQMSIYVGGVWNPYFRDGKKELQI